MGGGRGRRIKTTRGRGSGRHRRVPFSGKAKREYLKEKRAKKAQKRRERENWPEPDETSQEPGEFLLVTPEGDQVKRAVPNRAFDAEASESESESESESDRSDQSDHDTDQTVEQSDDQTVDRSVPADMFAALTGSRGNAAASLITVFARESPKEIQRRKRLSQQPMLERTVVPYAEADLYNAVVRIPEKPSWRPSQSKEAIQQRQQERFQEYLRQLYARYGRERLNRFEHNLLVWRELWRVCETCNAAAVIVDARHPFFHFSPGLYRYVTQTLRKPMLVVFNKIDLVPVETVDLWERYFAERFPEVRVVRFSAFAQHRPPRSRQALLHMQARRRQDRGAQAAKAAGVAALEEALNEVVEVRDEAGERVEISLENEYLEWYLQKKKKDRRRKGGKEAEQQEDEENDEIGDETERAPPCRPRHRLNLALLGQPNVGKSSVINALLGVKRAAVSYTPGRTKHLQTLYLSPRVMLIDCPGLVPPALDMPPQLQILGGTFPIAQCREPYSVVQFLAERVPLEDMYNLRHTQGDTAAAAWSAWDICEALAEKKGYRTKSGKPDTYRAANAILRDALEGRVVLSFLPPRDFCLGVAEEENKCASDTEQQLKQQQEQPDEQEEETQEKRQEKRREKRQEAKIAKRERKNRNKLDGFAAELERLRRHEDRVEDDDLDLAARQRPVFARFDVDAFDEFDQATSESETSN